MVGSNITGHQQREGYQQQLTNSQGKDKPYDGYRGPKTHPLSAESQKGYNRAIRKADGCTVYNSLRIPNPENVQ